MKPFVDYTADSVIFKNTHIEHLEDLLFEPNGAEVAVDILAHVGHVLSFGGESRFLHFSVKWDGAPALVFGPDPSGAGFFVATKAAFNKTPKLAHSHAEIDALYTEPVAGILHTAFDRLHRLAPDTVLQGDLMFREPDVTLRFIGNELCYVFQPNALLYAIKQRSPLGERMAHAALGIAVHTRYTGAGDSLATYRALPIGEFFSVLHQTNDVLCFPTSIDQLPVLTPQEDDDCQLALYRATAEVQRLSPSMVTLAGIYRPLISKFINSLIRENRSLSSQWAEFFFDFLNNENDRERETRKTIEGKAAVDARYHEIFRHLFPLRQELNQWHACHRALASAKNMLVRKLAASPTGVQTFTSEEDVLKPTAPEGFVVSLGGTVVKLVDRYEFSRINFTNNPKYRS